MGGSEEEGDCQQDADSDDDLSDTANRSRMEEEVSCP